MKQSTMPTSLRSELVSFVARAIDSTVNYSGEEADQNKHNWIQITTDRAIAAFVAYLPEPIDVASKYETGPGGNISVSVSGEDEDFNGSQLNFLSKYSEDIGWNHYHHDVMSYLQALYNTPSPMIQSDHDTDQSRPQQEDSDESSDKEPSQVR